MKALAISFLSLGVFVIDTTVILFSISAIVHILDRLEDIFWYNSPSQIMYCTLSK